MGGKKAHRPKGCVMLMPSLVLLTMLFIYGVFVSEVLMPQFEVTFSNELGGSIWHADKHTQPASSTSLVVSTIIFHISFILMLISFFRAMLTCPGNIPEEAKWINGTFRIAPTDEAKVQTLVKNTNPTGLGGLSVVEYMSKYLTAHPTLGPSNLENVEQFLENWIHFMRRFPLLERKHPRPAKNGQPAEPGGKKRFCKKCNLYKPDRSHHCKFCNRCILRMDHHCPWIANCVGFFNYKYFLLTMFHAVVCCGIITFKMMPRLVNCFEPVLDVKFMLSRDVPVVLAELVASVVFVLLGGFGTFHVYLLTHAMTTIEYEEKKGSKSKLMRHRFAVAHIKYDKGIYGNLIHVLGPIHKWLLPVPAWSSQDGLYMGTVETESICC